jgi:hypothetical protein
MIRRGLKVTLSACCAVVASAASWVGLAAVTPASMAAQLTAQSGSGSAQWNLNGSNSVDVGYDGQGFVYSVTFKQSGSSLSGTLDDPYYPTSGPISGTISGDSARFTFSYPSGSVQGTRTYTGSISQSGGVSGTWTQTGDESPDNGTWTLADTAVPGPSSSPTCDASYRTVVTDKAGFASVALAQLYSDKVTVTWCTNGSEVRILSSRQVPSVEKSGFSVPGAEIAALKFLGLGFGVTPATAPVPAIDNETSYASATASGLSFTGDFNLGADLVAFVSSTLGGSVAKGLAAEVAPLIRSGDLGRASKVLLKGWDALAAAFVSWADRHFDLPASWAAGLLENLPIEKIEDAVVKLTGTFVSVATQTLASLNRDPTVADVIDAMKQAIQQIASALDFPWVAWAPQITVTVRQVATVDVSGTKGFGITVEEPSWTTTP